MIITMRGGGGNSNWPPATINAGNTPAKASATNIGTALSTYMTRVASISITKSGTYRFKWVMVNWFIGEDADAAAARAACQTQLYRGNSQIYGTTHNFGSTGDSAVVVACSNDVQCNAGDTISVYGKTGYAGAPVLVAAFTANVSGDNGF